MRFPGFVSGTHASRSILANNERTINWYPENVGDRLVLYPTAGLKPWVTTSYLRGRAAFSENGRAFFVFGPSFVEVTAQGDVTLRGTVTEDTQPAQIISNGRSGSQLLIASGTNAYCFDLNTNVFTQVLTGDAYQIAMLDTYCLAFSPATGRVRYSGRNLADSWDPNSWFARAVAPDPWRAMIVNQGRIFLIGEYTGEVWWDAGGSSIPFAPITSSVFTYGIIAPWSLHVVGDSVRWLSQTRHGSGIVVSAKGYRPERISDHATEHALAGYMRHAHIDDCEALSYIGTGHTFSVFRFPSADTTRVFDDATQMWHERATWDATHNLWHVWRPRAHCQAFGMQLVVDADTGIIAQLDPDTTTDLDGGVIRRMRITPTLHGEGERVFLDRFELYVEPGLAPQPGQPYDDPQVMLQVSYDGGKTWGNERKGGSGQVGDYTRRVNFQRCGSGWSITCKVVCSDPVPWNVIDCFIDAPGVVSVNSQPQPQQGAA